LLPGPGDERPRGFGGDALSLPTGSDHRGDLGCWLIAGADRRLDRACQASWAAEAAGAEGLPRLASAEELAGPQVFWLLQDARAGDLGIGPHPSLVLVVPVLGNPVVGPWPGWKYVANPHRALAAIPR
jgi:hypothetical protein